MKSSSNHSSFLLYASLLFLLQFGPASKIFSQNLPQHVIVAYEKDGWVYFGKSTFLHGDRYNSEGYPEVLSLEIDQATGIAMLFLTQFDCINQRMMIIAYKRFQNKLFIEKEHYLFDHKKEWQYPLKTSLGDLMLTAVCDKYGN